MNSKEMVLKKRDYRKRKLNFIEQKIKSHTNEIERLNDIIQINDVQDFMYGHIKIELTNDSIKRLMQRIDHHNHQILFLKKKRNKYKESINKWHTLFLKFNETRSEEEIDKQWNDHWDLVEKIYKRKINRVHLFLLSIKNKIMFFIK